MDYKRESQLMKAKENGSRSNTDGNAPESQRVLYADLLRVISAFAVITIHVVSNAWSGTLPETAAWQVLNIYDAAARFCVPVFIMVSGMFFLDPEKPMPVQKIYGKYLLRIGVAYVFWSLVYAVFHNIAVYGRLDLNVLEQIFRYFLRGHHTLWFLIMLAGLYLITPILRIMTQYASRRILEYFLLLSFLFAGFFPTFLRSLEESALKQLVDYYLGHLNIHFVLGFTCYYLAGYYFKTYRLSRRQHIAIYLAGIFGLAATIGLTLWISLKKGYGFSLYYEYLSPNVMLMSAGIFVFAKEYGSRFCTRPRIGKMLRHLSSCTFGIYLVHDFVNRSLAALGWDILGNPPLYTVPLYVLAVFAISYGIVFLLKKIPIVSQYLI